MTNERMIMVSSDLLERAISLLDLLPESGTIRELRNVLVTQPAAGEPVYQYRGLSGEWIEVKHAHYDHQKKHGWPVRILWTSPPAAAHGDEAVRKLVLPTPEQVMNVVMKFQWEDRKNGTGTTNWAANLGMTVVEYVALLNSDAAMRAQGDGEVQ